MYVFIVFQFKTQMQIQIIRAKSGAEVQYRHVFHAGHMIIKQFGIRGAYQGLGATWLRDLPSFAAFFGKSNSHHFVIRANFRININPRQKTWLSKT